ncbi:MAG: 1-acyl-sn-glycerol-3-phosphate acyltransferase, partial [Candidatus Azobacteroides sp.]|nr:1-acyl-sn-glycerol-3-phosphate acyltransferase [Candidatus Azobacteroides sp.]
FFEHRKALLWLLLLAIIGALALSTSRISFVEDISSFLPNNADNKRINEAYQHLGMVNKIMITFSQKDTANGIDEDRLTNAAARFAEILQENDSMRHIKDLMVEVDNEKVKEITDFIVQNLPYFLEEEDYHRIDSLLQLQALENQLKTDKDLLMSPMGGFVRSVILNDPLHFSQNALNNLNNFKQNENYNTDNGFIFNDKGECIVIITSKYPISETKNNKLLANEIYNAINQTVVEYENEIKIVPFGTALISITNADQIKNDTLFSVSIALVLILALLFYFFRSFKDLFYIILSVIFGALFAMGMVALFKPTVSIIAIGMASIIIGIAINYPLHFLAHFRHNPNMKQTIKEIVNPLLTGNITTVGAFLALLFISSDAMKDLGWLSSFLLAGTILFVLIFLPFFLLDTRHKTQDTRQGEGVVAGGHEEIHKKQAFERLSNFSPEKNKFIVSIFLILTVVLFIFSFGTKFETNLQSINYMTAEQRAEMNKLMEQNKGNGKTLYTVAEGKTPDEALKWYEQIVIPDTKSSLDSNLIDNCFGIGKYLPTKETQEQKIARWNEFWQNKKDVFMSDFNEIAKKQHFNTGVFNGFIELMNKDFHTQEFEYFYNPLKDLAENYISINKDKTLIYTILQFNPQVLSKDAAWNNVSKYSSFSSNVFTFDDSSIAERMANALSNDFNNVLYICSFIVFVFLFFSFGQIETTVITFIPMAVGWFWILGLMNIFGMKFNIVNIILATFIFGQGDDYTIFVTEGLIYEYAYRKKMLASFKNSIILSATILFIAIGMLIFAKHPAMRSLAGVTIVGMFSVVICAYVFPPLIFRYLTTKKGKMREVPWTVMRFLRMMYYNAFFLMGILTTTIYSFILFGFRKKTNPKDKLRYHKLLHWSANFVIRRVPGVKFYYENLSGETFDEPAVIISNHQSQLDLMCLMMLTPKLIILTNDWVWNNPFYGRNIRYAEYYPVSKGIENSLAQLSDAVQRGYSIVIFPEGTRSADCSIGRFHHGAFYLAEKLNVDIVPVFLHGVGHVLPKNDFLLRKGRITVQVRERITPNDNRFAADYSTRTKQVCQYYRETFAEISKKIETIDYFKSFVLHNYMYKGIEVWRGANKECRGVLHTPSSHTPPLHTPSSHTPPLHTPLSHTPPSNPPNSITIENSGYGVYAFLYALSHKDINVIAVEEDEDKVALARACAGLPKNITIYHTSEWKNT